MPVVCKETLDHISHMMVLCISVFTWRDICNVIHSNLTSEAKSFLSSEHISSIQSEGCLQLVYAVIQKFLCYGI